MAANPSPPSRLGRSILGGVVAVAILVGACGPASAASTSRVFGTGLFVAGIGLKMGGIITGSDAQSAIDDYLVTANQNTLATLREDVRSQRELSRSLSSTADGLMVAGALLAAYSLLRAGQQERAEATLLRTRVRMAPRRGALALLWERRF